MQLYPSFAIHECRATTGRSDVSALTIVNQHGLEEAVALFRQRSIDGTHLAVTGAFRR